MIPVKQSAAFVILSCMVLMGCTNRTMNARIVDDGTQLPPDLGLAPDTLLAVLHGSRAYDDVLAAKMARHYTGPYRLVSRSDVESACADVEVYRYVFDSEEQKREYAMSASEAGTRFFVVDRKARRTYSADYMTSAYGDLMEAYLRKLDAKRIANGGR